MNYSAIPDELKAMPNWVCANRDSKVPMRAYELKAASASNPNTWDSFDSAVEAVNEGVYDYAGYVFSDSGIVGIDIDKGFDEDYLLTDLAEDVIQACNSYTELSKSGRGFHILVKGVLPFNGKNNGAGCEIYKNGRFFICTGNVLENHSMLITNQEAIDYVVEKYFPETIRDSKVSEHQKIYSCKYELSNGKVCVIYPEINQGCRNVSLLSICSQLRVRGLKGDALKKEMLRLNQKVCKPPLPDGEVLAIIKSSLKYKM